MLFAYLCLSAACCLVVVIAAWLYFARTVSERRRT
jgi:hypothetical protein